MRSAGKSESTGSRGATSGEWGAGATSLSAMVAGAYRSAVHLVHASPLQGLGGWGEGGGNGGGNNGTDSGVPRGDEKEGEGGGEQGAVDVNAHVMDDANPNPAEYGAVPPKCSAFGPWVWMSALWGFYAVWLRRAPMLTKALTSGALALGGDTAAQCFEFQEKKRGGPFLQV